MSVPLSINFFNLFQYATVYGCNVNWIKWNKCWNILLLSSCFRVCCNFLDSGLCALCVVLQREYKFFTVLSELYKVFINLWIPDGATFWCFIYFWVVGKNRITVKIFGIYGKTVTKPLHIFLLTLHFWTSHIPMFNSVLSGIVTPSYHQEKV